jgi:hypothetical protein
MHTTFQKKKKKKKKKKNIDMFNRELMHVIYVYAFEFYLSFN